MIDSDQAQQKIALIVDDTPDSLSVITDALEGAGITALIARDGYSAIDLVSRIAPDAILMDAMMPGLDGFETCRLIKRKTGMSEVPIIFMTGLSDSENIVKGLSAGGVDYLTKPIDVDVLLARMSVHIANSRLISDARTVLDLQGHSVIAISTENQVSWSSPKATEFLSSLRALLGQDMLLPEITEWLYNINEKPLSETNPLILTITDENARQGPLELVYLGRSSSGDILASVKPVSDQPAHAALSERFALTQREGEVLYWVSQGKTNRDVGEILELSPRTVNKHLEQIFVKMGVDNRTAAAISAIKSLNTMR